MLLQFGIQLALKRLFCCRGYLEFSFLTVLTFSITTTVFIPNPPQNLGPPPSLPLLPSPCLSPFSPSSAFAVPLLPSLLSLPAAPSVPAAAAAMVGFADLLNPVGDFSPRPTPSLAHRAGTGSNPLSISTRTRIPTEAIYSHASALLSPPSSPSSPAPTDDSPNVSVRVFPYSHASISSHLIIIHYPSSSTRFHRCASKWKVFHLARSNSTFSKVSSHQPRSLPLLHSPCFDSDDLHTDHVPHASNFFRALCAPDLATSILLTTTTTTDVRTQSPLSPQSPTLLSPFSLSPFRHVRTAAPVPFLLCPRATRRDFSTHIILPDSH